MAKSLNSLSKKLRSFEKELSDTILSRENYFDSKSDRWQESQAGVKYQEDTSMIQDAVSIIDDALTYFPEPPALTKKGK